LARYRCGPCVGDTHCEIHSLADADLCAVSSKTEHKLIVGVIAWRGAGRRTRRLNRRRAGRLAGRG
jgi:hypothetical protein